MKCPNPYKSPEFDSELYVDPNIFINPAIMQVLSYCCLFLMGYLVYNFYSFNTYDQYLISYAIRILAWLFMLFFTGGLVLTLCKMQQIENKIRKESKYGLRHSHLG